MRRDEYIEQTLIAFAMYCDTAGLSLEEGQDLAADLGAELEQAADDRQNYLPGAAE